jgi:hypothetical protein
LTAAAIYRYMDLISQDSAFTWSVLGDIGTIDQNGFFVASTKEEKRKDHSLRRGILSVLSM